MKRLLLAMTIVMTSLLAWSGDMVSVFLFDNSGSDTNIRNAPKGKVIAKLDRTGEYILTLTEPKNGWWKIVDVEEATEGREIQLKKTGYIHYSTVGFATRNYGGQRLYLREYPNDGAKVLYSFTDELVLHPLEVVGDWVKVVTADGKHTGWIEYEWTCGNPLTNCC